MNKSLPDQVPATESPMVQVLFRRTVLSDRGVESRNRYKTFTIDRPRKFRFTVGFVPSRFSPLLFAGIGLRRQEVTALIESVEVLL